MVLDRFTMRNLELLESNHPDGKSLLDVLDRTASPMGARLLRQWLSLPLLHTTRIAERLDTVEFFLKEGDLRLDLVKRIHSLGDLERTLGRIAMGKSGPRELGQIRFALQETGPIQQNLLNVLEANASKPAHENNNSEGSPDPFLLLAQSLQRCPELLQVLQEGLADELPTHLGKGPVIRSGYSSELDELRGIGADGRNYLVALQQKEA